MPHHHWPGPLLSKQRKGFDLSFLLLGLFSLLILENCSCPRVPPEKRCDSRRASLCEDEIPNGIGKRHFRSIHEQVGIEPRNSFLLIGFPAPSSSRISRSVLARGAPAERSRIISIFHGMP